MSHEFLSALDSAFLAIEDDCNHMHVALTGVFDKTPVADATGLLDMGRIRRYAELTLASLPKFRQRLAWTDWLGHPVLVDDVEFDLSAHVRYVVLDPPGDEEQLKALLGRLYSEPLDRARPLWEQWYVDGLAGHRFAVVSKAHHCLVDGVAGVGAVVAMLRTDTDATIRDASDWHPQPLPTGLELLREEVVHRLREPSLLLDIVRERVRARLARESAPVEALRSAVSTMARWALPTTRTRLNPTRIGARRDFDWVRCDFDIVRELKHRSGGKINDVVLACVAGAVRRYLQEHGDPVAGLRFRALIPVSLHDPTRNVIHNEVSLMVAPLPIGEPDARRRLELVIAETREAKRSGQTDLLGLAGAVADVAAHGAIGLSAKAMVRLRPFNIIVTNIPGPPFPLYLLGARMLEAYPMVPLYMNQAVGVAVLSYDGGLYFGLNADAAHMTDVRRFSDALRRSMGDLQSAFGLSPDAQGPPA